MASLVAVSTVMSAWSEVWLVGEWVSARDEVVLQATGHGRRSQNRSIPQPSLVRSIVVGWLICNVGMWLFVQCGGVSQPRLIP